MVRTNSRRLIEVDAHAVPVHGLHLVEHLAAVILVARDEDDSSSIPPHCLRNFNHVLMARSGVVPLIVIKSGLEP